MRAPLERAEGRHGKPRNRESHRGHESVETTQMYIHADMQLKEKAMARTQPAKITRGRYQPNDKLLAFLEGL